MRRSPCAALAVVSLALVLAGCGAQDDALDRFHGPERAVAETVVAFAAAARRQDATTVCRDLLAKEASAPLGKECPRRMAAALGAVDQQGLEVVSVHFKGGTAIATVVTGSGTAPRSGSLALVPEGGRWRIARVGPLPPPGADAGVRSFVPHRKKVRQGKT